MAAASAAEGCDRQRCIEQIFIAPFLLAEDGRLSEDSSFDDDEAADFIAGERESV